jgi:hypothetical protein
MLESTINIFKQILGSDWIESQLDAYSSFRKTWSPKYRWYHRKPDISPLVPLVYWSTREEVTELQEPFGFWGGNPEEILNRLAEEIIISRSIGHHCRIIEESIT